MSLRRYFDRHPAVALSLACLMVIYAVARSVQAVMRARGTVHANWWAPAVAVGLASSLLLISVTTGSIWWAHHRRIRSAWLAAPLLGLCGMLVAGLMYTGPAVMPKVGPPETVTTGFQLAAIVFMIPLYGGIAALLVVMCVWLARNRKRTTASNARLSADPRVAARLICRSQDDFGEAADLVDVPRCRVEYQLVGSHAGERRHGLLDPCGVTRHAVADEAG